MPNKIRIRNLRAADPGLGFKLDLSELTVGTRQGQFNPQEQLDIRAEIYEPANNHAPAHILDVSIAPPIDQTDTLVVVVPFGCTDYSPGSQIGVALSVSQPYGQDGTYFGLEPAGKITVTAEPGRFSYSVNQPSK